MSAHAAKTLSSILRTCLGPRSMQKMVLTKIGSIELTNDGNAILREMDVSHPSARSLIELSQTQDDECGDGTTSTLILSAELLSKTVTLLNHFHPIHICNHLRDAKTVSLDYLHSVSKLVGNGNDQLISIISAAVSTKLCTILNVPISALALKSAQLVKNQNNELNIKNDIKIEKILGELNESEVLDGIIIEKELIHNQMRKLITNPKILLIDSPLEYKKGESITKYEFNSPSEFNKALKSEEEQIKQICAGIIRLKPDLVITEKGISDLALSILYENGISAIRRVKKSDLIRISRATNATIMTRIEDMEERHMGIAGLFEYVKINKTHYCKITGCDKPKAISVVLRGPSMDLIAELERNFMDAIKVARNVLRCQLLVPGGGSTEAGIAIHLRSIVSKIDGEKDKLKKEVYMACADAFCLIPTIIAVNSGLRTALGVMNELEMAQADNKYAGINGITGRVEDMQNIVMEPIVVKEQSIKSAYEAVMQLLRVDGIIETKSSQ